MRLLSAAVFLLPLTLPVLTLPVLTLPALAQDQPAFTPAATEACLQAEGTDCPGKSADACMETSPGGASTAGMNACIEAERAWWDQRLNAAYGALSDHEKSLKDMPALATTLRDMQRAWITYRDAACAYAGAQFSGGSGESTATLSCLMGETARQAMALESRLAEVRSR